LTSLLIPRTHHPRIPRSLPFSKDGRPEDWIKWLMGYRDIKTVMPLEKTKMLRTLLKGRTLSKFEYHLRNRLGAEDVALADYDILEIVIRDVGLEYIFRRAIRLQKYYMRRCLFMGHNMSVQQFKERKNQLNCYLLYSPEAYPTLLVQDEIVKILDQAKSSEWHEAMLATNIDIFEMNYEESISYFKRLENFEKSDARMVLL
jgi:hypothetical protein